MASLRPAAHALFAALLLLAAPLRAQINVNSAWQKGDNTDFLNLYQGTVSTGVKPEILMLIDSSLSTSRLMFHPLFPNNWLDESPPGAPTGSQDYDVYIGNSNSNWPTAATASPSTGVVVGQLTNTFSVGFGSSSVVTVSASGNTYTIGGTHLNVQVGSTWYPTNTLIKPDGTEVLASDVTTAGGNLKSAVSWMQCASHMRLRLTAVKIGSGGTTTLTATSSPAIRDIDFPLYWAPIDSTSTIAAGATAGDKGLYRARALDPTPPGTNTVEIETDVTTSSPSWWRTGAAALGNSTSVTITGSSAGSVRSRYIEWVFVGQDPGNAGYYCIPNALPTGNAANAIDPTTLSYNGASDTWSWGTMTSTALAFGNKLPNRTRMQGIKESAIKTWLSHQTGVMFAFRFLDGQTDNSAITVVGGSSTAAAWNYINSTTDLLGLSGASPSTTTPLVESLMNCYQQMNNPAAFQAQINTNKYLAAALACQHHFVVVMTDGSPSSLNAATEGSCSFPYAQTAVVTGCTSNPAGSGTTYTAPSSSGTPLGETYTGNAAIKALIAAGKTSALTASPGIYFNLPTMAAVAAHGGDGSTTSPTWISDPGLETSTGSSDTSYLPFWVNRRIPYGAATASPLSPAHPIQTMTVGVSLGVDFYSSGTTAWTNTYGGTHAPQIWNQAANSGTGAGTAIIPVQSDHAGSKYRLLAAAVFGDPSDSTYDITNKSPFYLISGTTTMADDASYFFDGRDPQTLVQNLSDAFDQIQSKSGLNATASPVFPTIGGGLGAEVYIANFLPPQTNGPVWTGDLLMYPTRETTTGTRLIDTNGAFITAALDKTNAIWSASTALTNRTWLNRAIYTRMPATSGNASPGLTKVVPGSDGKFTSDAGYTLITPLLPGSNATNKLLNWQKFVGADAGSGTAPLGTRASIMGDIINSSPAVLEYTTLPDSVNTFSPSLAAAWLMHSPTGAITGAHPDTTGHFRVIIVGTNQGLLHCFGEVSWTDSTTNTSVPITRGVVDELWAFAPTDIIPYIDYFWIAGLKHRFSVDGSPTVYLLDLPQSSSQTTGNGKFDVAGTNTERAIIVFGLGKGGRSYYALNIADPGSPTMAWALCPDEPYNYPASRIKSGQATAPIANMGLSTSIPTVARVTTSLETSSNQVVDAILLGGGYSDTTTEAQLPGSLSASVVTYTGSSGSLAGPALNTKLGRSAVAIEVSTGHILRIWDTSGTTGAGPVSTGVVPFEYAVGSGLNQRAYFTDIYGSLWALGSNSAQGSGGYASFILDSASIDSWVPRQVYLQQVTNSNGNGLNSSLPVPFNIPYFPVARTSPPLITPGAIGVAFVTGDRNNPMDDITYTMWPKPTQHRLNVLFDRQDTLGSSALAATNLADASSGTFSTSSSNSNYYLNNTGKSGYFINFPAGGTYVPKGIVPPLLINGALFYSYFNPTTSSCAGGTGTTETFRICNVMQPTVNTAATWSATDASTVTPVNGCYSGRILEWTGVASNLALRSVLAGVQAGMTGGSGVTVNPTSTQNLVLQDLSVQGTDAYAKVRVWRVVH